jgi:hypothetical protein
MPEQPTTSAPELTDEEALAKLEERVAAMEPGPFRHSWEEIVAIEKNRQRIRRIEEATRVKLPPDNRGWSGKPARSSTPPAEPSPERPSGWAKFDPLSSPPGIDMIDRMVEADTARQRADAIAAEVQRRQAIIDIYHEAKVVDEQRTRAAAERTCHKGPGDADWDIK